MFRAFGNNKLYAQNSRVTKKQKSSALRWALQAAAATVNSLPPIVGRNRTDPTRNSAEPSIVQFVITRTLTSGR